MIWADVGANVGYFTVIGHKLVQQGGGRTWAFEASPVAYDFLVDNIELNWFFSGVTAEQKAVYSHSTELSFTVPEKHGANATLGNLSDSSLHRVRDRAQKYKVPAVSLDEYFTRLPVCPNFIKFDIEGGEYFALQGARRLLNTNPELKLLLEWSPAQCRMCGVEPQQLAALINELALECQLAEGDRRRVSAQDLTAVDNTTMILLTKNK
jgi:FkbM family methyltransferase